MLTIPIKGIVMEMKIEKFEIEDPKTKKVDTVDSHRLMVYIKGSDELLTVKTTKDQYPTFTEGEMVELLVDLSANRSGNISARFQKRIVSREVPFSTKGSKQEKSA